MLRKLTPELAKYIHDVRPGPKPRSLSMKPKSSLGLPGRGLPIDRSDFTRKNIRAFWNGVPENRNDDGCWEWTAGKLPNGYGRICVDGRATYAHRASYALNVGPVPQGLGVLHSCDNPSCVNPRHLFLGNQSDNAADRDRKGRGRYGPNRPGKS